MFHRVERAGIKTLREGIVDQPIGHPEDSRIVQIVEPVTFERAEIVGIAEFRPQRLEDRPVAVAGVRAEGRCEMRAEVVLDPVIVQQRVVDVEQEDNVVHRDQPGADGWGFRHGPSDPISASAPAGPQLPGSYCWQGGGEASTGSTIRHCASTTSCLENSSPSPRIASPSRR